jgi:hypothetical protein
MPPSFLEITVGVAILSVGAIAVASTGLASERIELEDAEHALARSTALLVENEVLTAADAAASGEQPLGELLLEAFDGRTRPVAAELRPWTAGQSVLEIDVVVDERLSDEELGTALGLPRDLDGDGSATNPAVAAEARLVPVVVRLRWLSGEARREYVHGFFVRAH